MKEDSKEPEAQNFDSQTISNMTYSEIIQRNR